MALCRARDATLPEIAASWTLKLLHKRHSKQSWYVLYSSTPFITLRSPHTSARNSSASLAHSNISPTGADLLVVGVACVCHGEILIWRVVLLRRGLKMGKTTANNAGAFSRMKPSDKSFSFHPFAIWYKNKLRKVFMCRWRPANATTRLKEEKENEPRNTSFIWRVITVLLFKKRMLWRSENKALKTDKTFYFVYFGSRVQVAKLRTKSTVTK